MSWEQVQAIVAAARQEWEQNRKGPPAACPLCGTPLSSGPEGELFCVFEGWTWDGGPVTW